MCWCASGVSHRAGSAVKGAAYEKPAFCNSHRFFGTKEANVWYFRKKGAFDACVHERSMILTKRPYLNMQQRVVLNTCTAIEARVLTDHINEEGFQVGE